MKLILLSLFVVLVSARADEQTELAQVWVNLLMGNWGDAEKALPALTTSASADIACQARFAEGSLWEFRRPTSDLARAQTAYRWIVERHPENALAPWAALALARIPDLAVLQPDPRAACALYRKVMADYPASPAAQEAVLHLAEGLVAKDGQAGAQEAVGELERWTVQHPNPKYAAEMELLLGDLYRYPLADDRKAVTHAARALDLGLATLVQQTRTCWMIAAVADQDLHDRDLAVEYYTRFLKEFPRDPSRFRAKQALERLGAPVPVLDDLTLKTVGGGP